MIASASIFLSLSLSLALPAQGRRTEVVKVAERAGPAVVNIGAEVLEQNPFRRQSPVDEFWRDFFRDPRPRQRAAQSLGSGVIIERSGQLLVLTNEHVINRASSITITLKDRRTFEVDVVGTDPAFDIAVLRARTKETLPSVEVGTSSDLMPGEPVVAIGNPFGLSNSVTTGVVSALHRTIQAEEKFYEDFIQTDAAINPGNSGGALLNIEGKLIGINTAIYREANGIGFAIPIDKALAVVEEVVQYGGVRPVFLGIFVDRASEGGGAVVRAIDPDSVAAQAGLKPGDRIVDLSGQQVKSGADFAKLQRGLVPGQTVRLEIVRDGRSMSLELKARELSKDKAIAMGKLRLGLEVKDSKSGLVVSRVRKGSFAARVGIREGDVLLSIGGRPLRRAAELDEIAVALIDAEAVAVIIGRAGRRYYVALQLDDV